MPEEKILKHHQWVLLDRKHVFLYVTEEKQILELFTPHPPYENVWWVPDESVFGTYLYYKDLKHEIIDSCVTYTDWSNPSMVGAFDNLDWGRLERMREEKCFFGRKFHVNKKDVDINMIRELTLKRTF